MQDCAAGKRWRLMSTCERGHPQTSENVSEVLIRRKKYQVCKACRREADKQRRERRREGVPVRKGNYLRGSQPISNPALLAGLIDVGYAAELVARWAHVKVDRMKLAIALSGFEVTS